MTALTQDTRKRERLGGAESKFGFAPNALRQVSDSPAPLEIYMNGQATLGREHNQLARTKVDKQFY